jgi:PAS domain S-box-containing protein
MQKLCRATLDANRDDRTVIASGETQTYEEHDFVIDGETRSYVAVTGAWRDAQGDVVGVFGISRDITERKRAKEKLRASEAELRALFEAMNDLIMVFDGEGRCLKIAPTNPLNLYRPPEEMLGKTFHEVFPKEQADIFLDQVQRTLETRSTNPFEFNLQLDDRLGWFEATFSPMLENTVVAVARDISERKENEEALRESESRLAEAQRLASAVGNGT